MRILLVHNQYQQQGGEDLVFANEAKMLRQYGHDVEILSVSNDEIQSPFNKLSTAILSSYNPQGYQLVADAIRRSECDIVHVHNFFPRLSPAIFSACRKANVPSVWTLHNFRVVCAGGMLFRDGATCEKCVRGNVLPAIKHRCYRGSLPGSIAVAGMIGIHRWLGTWQHKVDRFISLTEFARAKLVEGGLPFDKIAVKPNWVEDPVAQGLKIDGPRKGAVFVGRLSLEKGVKVLLDAWKALPDIPLTIIGDGPERASLEPGAPANVRFVGKLDRANVNAAMAGAQALVVPSLWLEGFPLVLIEGMAAGVPLLASDIGALPSIIENGQTGVLVEAGNVQAWAKALRAFFDDEGAQRAMGLRGRKAYEERFSPQQNIGYLEKIYQDAREEYRRRDTSASSVQ